MTTKARRETTELRCWAALLAQSRLNAGEALSRGRTNEARCWTAVAEVLDDALRRMYSGQRPGLQLTFWPDGRP